MLNNEKKEKLGVVLFNLGGPDKLEDVRPFLYNFFLQPEIIRVRSNLLRKFIAWFISTTRHKKSAGYYSLIGGGSPQRRITEEQATALKAELRRRGIEINIYVAMRCWQPYTEAVVEAIENDRVTRVIGLPLYPHYSLSTTHSSFKHFIKVLSERGGMRHIKRHYITTWYDHPKYIDAVVETIKDA
ncbi:MAG: ferrochelatase, partial [Blastocatellia bacterium]|nr:ferrochelatase [Blastocatellia bacterium]